MSVEPRKIGEAAHSCLSLPSIAPNCILSKDRRD
jgi:hypothetical protein